MGAQRLLLATPVGTDDERDPLAQPRVRIAERDRLLDEPRSDRGFLDLGRADSIARRLDHTVLAGDGVEKLFAVAADAVARPDRHAAIGRARGRGLEPLG